MLLTYEDVDALLNYAPLDGTLSWRSPGHYRRTDKAGRAAGALRKDGYLQLQIFGKKYLAHRVCWLIGTGVWPSGQIDHKNRVRTDNRLANLRDVPQTNNQHNRGLNTNNTTGVPGVAPHACGRFEAYIYVEKTRHYLGLYPDVASAARARAQAENALNPRGTM